MSRIVVNPEILGGKPIIQGTRLSVEHVWGLLTSSMSTGRDYRELSGIERRKPPSGPCVCFGACGYLKAHGCFAGTPQWSDNRSSNYPG